MQTSWSVRLPLARLPGPRLAFYRQHKPPNSESKCSFKQSQKEEQRKAKQLARAGKRAKAKASAAAGRKAAGKKRINPPRAGAQRAYFHARLQHASKQDWGNRRALFQRLGREFKSLPRADAEVPGPWTCRPRQLQGWGSLFSGAKQLQETSSQDLTVAVIPVADAVSADQAELTGLVAKASDLQKLARHNASQLARRQEDIDDVRHAQVASFVAVDLEGSSKLALPKDLFELGKGKFLKGDGKGKGKSKLGGKDFMGKGKAGGGGKDGDGKGKACLKGKPDAKPETSEPPATCEERLQRVSPTRDSPM